MSVLLKSKQMATLCWYKSLLSFSSSVEIHQRSEGEGREESIGGVQEL